jgi:uncharacterized protein (TIGR02246 family)
MTSSPAPQSEAEAGIKQFNETVMAAFRNKDAAAMAALWTENTRFLPPGGDIIMGPAGVEAVWQTSFDQGAYDLDLESVEIRSLGDGVAYEIGRSIVRVRTTDGSSIEVPGKSVCIFRREADGIWRADVDIFNAIEG